MIQKDIFTKFLEDAKPGGIINRHRQSQFFKVTEEAEMWAGNHPGYILQGWT